MFKLDTIAHYLKSKNTATRCRAARDFGLAVFNGQNIRPYLHLLFAALGDSNALVREQAAETLRQAADKKYVITRAFSALQSLLSDSEPSIVQDAATTFVAASKNKNARKKVVHILEEALLSSNSLTQKYATFALTQLDVPIKIPLTQAIKEGKIEGLLAMLPNEYTEGKKTRVKLPLDEFIEMYDEGINSQTKNCILSIIEYLIGKKHDVAKIAALLKKGIGDKDINIRRSALFKAQKYYFKEKKTPAIESVIMALADKSHKIRREASEIMGGCRWPKKDQQHIINLLIPLLEDKHSWIQWNAANALRHGADQGISIVQVVSKVIPLIEKEKSPYIRNDFTRLLLTAVHQKIPFEEPLYIFKKLLSDTDITIRSNATEALVYHYLLNKKFTQLKKIILTEYVSRDKKSPAVRRQIVFSLLDAFRAKINIKPITSDKNIQRILQDIVQKDRIKAKSVEKYFKKLGILHS